MRFTLLDAGDVEVPDGMPLRAARGALAGLTGVAALRDAPLEADGRALPDDLPAGVEPWVEGSRVGVRAGREREVGAGVAAEVGRGTGGWPAGGARRAGEVLRGVGAARSGGAVPWADEGRAAPGRRWVVALDGPRAGRAWPAPTLRARLTGFAREGLRPARRRTVERLVVTRLPRARPTGVRGAGSLATWLVPAAGGLAAAALWHSPAFAVLALVGVAPALVAARPRREPFAPGPARVSALAAARAAGLGGGRDDGPHAGTGGAAAGSRPARPGTWRAAATDGLALTGPRPAVLAAARGLVAEAVGEPGARVVLVTDRTHAADWRWLRWCADRVTVLDGAAVAAAGLAAGRDPTLRGASLVVVDHAGSATLAVGDGPRLAIAEHQAPAWCRRVEAAVRLPSAGQPWAEGRARDVAAQAARTGSGGLPTRVGLADLPVGGPGGWAVPIGVARGGPVDLDLVADGPHVLVAGTTGAGKSELLQTLVLALARRHGPDRLALVLVDFKGGAGLGACRDLPHVAGLVTDLDPAATARALDGLRAEVRAREALLAATGAADLEALRARGTAPPRVVVVVDELLALRDDLPGALPALVRLATQGRALGLHLVLATQRPAGALDAQVRANVAVRVCLRVADPADSLDVLGVPDAAELPARTPGRALLRVGDAAPLEVQTAWSALAPRARGVRWAPAWPAAPDHVAGGPTGPGTGGLTDGVTGTGHLAGTRHLAGTGEVAGHVTTLVAEAARRAVSAGTPSAAPLWRPPLPDLVARDEVDGLVGTVTGHLPTGPGVPAAPDGLRLGLVDRPLDRAVDPLVWRPGSGPLALVGPPGSGRSTGLRTVAQAAADRGRAVHLVLGRGGAGPRPHALAGVAPARVGTVVGADDPRRVVRLVELLCAGRRDDVLLVDDLGAALRALRTLPRGVGEDALGALLAARVPLALAGDEADLRAVGTTGLVVRLGERPVERQGSATPPHRDASPGAGTVGGLACRLAVPSAGSAAGLAPVPSDPDAPRPPAEPLRLAPLPDRVTAADVAATARRAGDPPAGDPRVPTVVLGLGGDDAGPVAVRLDRGLLVVGPAGSGRSAVLRHVLARMTGARAVTLDELVAPAPAGPFPTAPSRTPVTTSGAGTPAPVLVIDDADVLVRDRPDLDGRLADLAAAAEARHASAGPRPGPVPGGRPAGAEPEPARLVLAARTDRAATTFRGALAAVRGCAPVLVLDPLAPGSAEAAGVDLARACDPRRIRGRAVLVDRGRLVPLQVVTDD